jgi:hypothetical protein
LLPLLWLLVVKKKKLLLLHRLPHLWQPLHRQLPHLKQLRQVQWLLLLHLLMQHLQSRSKQYFLLRKKGHRKVAFFYDSNNPAKRPFT